MAQQQQQQQQQQPKEPEFNLPLTQTRLNVILAALSERPYKETAETISWIMQALNASQAQAQQAQQSSPQGQSEVPTQL